MICMFKQASGGSVERCMGNKIDLSQRRDKGTHTHRERKTQESYNSKVPHAMFVGKAARVLEIITAYVNCALRPYREC